MEQLGGVRQDRCQKGTESLSSNESAGSVDRRRGELLIELAKLETAKLIGEHMTGSERTAQ